MMPNEPDLEKLTPEPVHATAPVVDDATGTEPGVDYEVSLESLSQWQIAWRKFKRHRLALVGLVILVMLIVAAILGPIFMPFDFQTIPNPDVIVPAGRGPTLRPHLRRDRRPAA